VLTRRVDAERPRRHDLGRERLGVAALHFRDARLHGVSRQTAPDEDDESVESRDTVPAVGERLDRELELLVSLDGRSHARKVAAPG
jgi:hypothetical protein